MRQQVIRWTFALAIVFIAGANAEPARFEDVRLVLEALSDRLPPELRNPDQVKWTQWRDQRDRAIRERLTQGEVDSMVHLLLFGTSFTNQARISIDEIAKASREGLLRSRLDDLLKGMQKPGSNERLIFLGSLMSRQGMNPASGDFKAKGGTFILENLQRVLRERIELAAVSQQPQAFRDRGVSLDTTIFPNFGIEESLKELNAQGALKEVRRVAVIGPGLDFIDKELGYDYYPQQTTQPFAIQDSLLKLNLANPGALSVTVLDISDRVLRHIDQARSAAKSEYVVQLPADSAAWLPGIKSYWSALGDQTGVSIAPVPPPTSLKGLSSRAVRFREETVLACTAADLNIVLDQWRGERFDLGIATNLLVYYDSVEQGLALHNIAAMLKPGGLLITNDELPPVRGVPMKLAGSIGVSYQGSLGDRFFWYQRE